MKFYLHIKATRRDITPRRLAIARRALQKQADAVALFPELQPTQTPQERCEQFDRETVDMVQRWRDAEADRCASRISPPSAQSNPHSCPSVPRPHGLTAPRRGLNTS